MGHNDIEMLVSLQDLDLMIEEAEEMLEAEGFHEHSPAHPGQIHIERY